MNHYRTYRLVFLTFALFLGMQAVSFAAGTGVEIAAFTGGATSIFSALRAPTFVKVICGAILAMIFIQMYRGQISGGWTELLGGVLALGGWMGAEQITDFAYAAAGAVL